MSSIATFRGRGARATTFRDTYRFSKSTGSRTSVTRKYCASTGYLRATASYMAGIVSWWPGIGGAKEWRPDAALLTGAGGVALALAAAAGDDEPCWDRFLLVSLP